MMKICFYADMTQHACLSLDQLLSLSFQSGQRSGKVRSLQNFAYFIDLSPSEPIDTCFIEEVAR